VKGPVVFHQYKKIQGLQQQETIMFPLHKYVYEINELDIKEKEISLNLVDRNNLPQTSK